MYNIPWSINNLILVLSSSRSKADIFSNIKLIILFDIEKYHTIILPESDSPSKYGLLKPRVQIEEVNIGGAKINYATGFNAKFIEDNSPVINKQFNKLAIGNKEYRDQI